MSGDSSRGGVGGGVGVGDGPFPPHQHRQQPDFDLVLRRIEELNGLVGLDSLDEIVISGGTLGAGSAARFVRRKAIAVSFFKDGFRLDTQVGRIGALPFHYTPNNIIIRRSRLGHLPSCN